MRGNSQWLKFAIAGLVLVSLAACKSSEDAEAQTNEMGSEMGPTDCRPKR